MKVYFSIVAIRAMLILLRDWCRRYHKEKTSLANLCNSDVLMQKYHKK